MMGTEAVAISQLQAAIPRTLVMAAGAVGPYLVTFGSPVWHLAGGRKKPNTKTAVDSQKGQS